MSHPFNVPSVSKPTVKMSCTADNLKRARSRELRGGKMIYRCRCDVRNGLQLDCPLAQCQSTCSLDISKCPFKSRSKMQAAGDHRRISDCIPVNQTQVQQRHAQYQAQNQAGNASNDVYGVQEGYLQDGQTVVQTKDGTPVNLTDADVAYIDYGYPPMGMGYNNVAHQGASQGFVNTTSSTQVPKTSKGAKSGTSQQKSGTATPQTNTTWPTMTQQPYMMPGGNQFCYPAAGYQTMPMQYMMGPTQTVSTTSMGAGKVNDQSGGVPMMGAPMMSPQMMPTPYYGGMFPGGMMPGWGGQPQNMGQNFYDPSMMPVMASETMPGQNGQTIEVVESTNTTN